MKLLGVVSFIKQRIKSDQNIERIFLRIIIRNKFWFLLYIFASFVFIYIHNFYKNIKAIFSY